MAGIDGARGRKQDELEAARTLGLELRERTEGKDREDARGLTVYCDVALNQMQSGVRQRSGLMRLLSRDPPDIAMKVCPDCAESVQPAARICRFCGYEFAPRPEP